MVVRNYFKYQDAKVHPNHVICHTYIVVRCTTCAARAVWEQSITMEQERNNNEGTKEMARLNQKWKIK